MSRDIIGFDLGARLAELTRLPSGGFGDDGRRHRHLPRFPGPGEPAFADPRAGGIRGYCRGWF